MEKSVTYTHRIPVTLKARLIRLARAARLSPSDVVAMALTMAFEQWEATGEAVIRLFARPRKRAARKKNGHRARVVAK